jgi:hypothetical protein
MLDVDFFPICESVISWVSFTSLPFALAKRGSSERWTSHTSTIDDSLMNCWMRFVPKWIDLKSLSTITIDKLAKLVPISASMTMNFMTSPISAAGYLWKPSHLTSKSYRVCLIRFRTIMDGSQALQIGRS